VTQIVTSGLSPVRTVLPNGGVVLVQETSFSPAVTISIAFRAGSLYDPDDRAGLAHFTGRVIDRGTVTRSGDAIAEALDGVHQGDRVRIDGWLVEAQAPDGWVWRSSTSREDSGNGACELVYVCAVTRL